MKTVTTAELRKDASVLSGSFILNKMKQGRDKIIDKKFIVVEVASDVSDEVAIHEALQVLSDS